MFCEHYHPRRCRHFEAVEQRYCIGAVYIARACTTGNEIIRSTAVEGDFLYFWRKRKDIVVIFEEYHTFSGGRTCQRGVRDKIGLVGELIVFEAGSAHNHLQDSSDVPVNV